jgi:hypothetical protein
LTSPLAMPRRSSGTTRLTAAIRIAGPAMPAPPAPSTPMNSVRASSEPANGVRAVPAAVISTPTTSTGVVPKRTAAAPASGWVIPQTS